MKIVIIDSTLLGAIFDFDRGQPTLFCETPILYHFVFEFGENQGNSRALRECIELYINL